MLSAPEGAPGEPWCASRRDCNSESSVTIGAHAPTPRYAHAHDGRAAANRAPVSVLQPPDERAHEQDVCVRRTSPIPLSELQPNAERAPTISRPAFRSLLTAEGIDAREP